jgi:hypothetical protein
MASRTSRSASIEDQKAVTLAKSQRLAWRSSSAAPSLAIAGEPHEGRVEHPLRVKPGCAPGELGRRLLGVDADLDC